MTLTKSQVASLGGKATAVISRENALKKYYESPNRCLCCSAIIEVKPNQKIKAARVKKFCSQSCAAKINNARCPKRGKVLKEIKYKPIKPDFGQVTKADLFSKRKHYQSARNAIRRHAHKVFWEANTEVACAMCRYTHYVEVCHIKPVSSFSGKSTLNEINALTNLLGLCPNHHWEFDNGIIKLEEILRGQATILQHSTYEDDALPIELPRP